MASVLILVGCDDDNRTIKVGEQYTSIRAIEARGETHEYLIWPLYRGAGMVHLPNCKFCKEEK